MIAYTHRLSCQTMINHPGQGVEEEEESGAGRLNFNFWI
jgi:hypothetical protein